MNKTTVPKCPTLTSELLEYLDAVFPEQSPRRHETADDCRWKGGQRDVVNHLHAAFAVQHKLLTAPVVKPRVLRRVKNPKS